MAKADANGYVVGPAGGRVKKADVILAIRHATSLLSELPKGRSKRR